MQHFTILKYECVMLASLWGSIDAEDGGGVECQWNGSESISINKQQWKVVKFLLFLYLVLRDMDLDGSKLQFANMFMFMGSRGDHTMHHTNERTPNTTYIYFIIRVVVKYFHYLFIKKWSEVKLTPFWWSRSIVVDGIVYKMIRACRPSPSLSFTMPSGPDGHRDEKRGSAATNTEKRV